MRQILINHSDEIYLTLTHLRVTSFYLNETCYLFADKLTLVSQTRLIKRHKNNYATFMLLDFDQKKSKTWRGCFYVPPMSQR